MSAAWALLLASAVAASSGPDEGVPLEQAPRGKAQRVAVTDLDAASVDARLMRLFTEALLAELRKVKGLSIIGADEIRAMLDHEAQKQLMGCDEESSCLAEVAGALGADVLLVGAVADVGDERLITLKRIDQRSAVVAETYTARLARNNGEEVLATIGPAVETLFPDLPLREGATRGVGPELRLRLHPPPVPMWAFAGAAASAGVFTTGAVTAGVVYALARSAYDEEAGLGLAGGATDYRALERHAGVANAAAVVGIAGGALALALGVTTAALIPIVDWYDYAND